MPSNEDTHVLDWRRTGGAMLRGGGQRRTRRQLPLPLQIMVSPFFFRRARSPKCELVRATSKGRSPKCELVRPNASRGVPPPSRHARCGASTQDGDLAHPRMRLHIQRRTCSSAGEFAPPILCIGLIMRQARSRDGERIHPTASELARGEVRSAERCACPTPTVSSLLQRRARSSDGELAHPAARTRPSDGEPAPPTASPLL